MGVTKVIRKSLLKGPALILLAVIILFSCKTATAEDYARVQLYGHSFSNDVGVTTGVFALNKDFDLKTSGYFKYTIDVIGSDSLGISSISGASNAASGSGGIDDTRNEITVGGTRILGNGFAVDAYYDYSEEDDFLSHTPTISVKKELFNKNTTLSLGYSRNTDTVNGKYIGREMDRDTDNYFFGITQILSPVTLVYAGYSRSEAKGFMSEGIRLVALGAQDPALCSAETATCVDERFPGSRSRDAYMLGAHHYFSGGALDRSSVRLKFRYYDDDWDISSYTLEGEFYKYIGETNLVRLNYRYYDQSKASFFKAAYTGAPGELYRTASPQHEELQTHLVGAKLMRDLKMVENLKAEARYEYYNESTDVSAHIVMLGFKYLF